MPQIITDCIQGDDAWFTHRLNSIGSTSINRIAPMGKGYKDTLHEFVGEFLTGVPAEHFKFRHADRGNEYEPVARNEYEFITGNHVDIVSLIKGDNYNHVSTDGIIGADGILEIKVRIPSVWINLAEGAKKSIADERQIAWGLYVSERKWVDSVNYCPELHQAGKKYILIERITRNEKMINELQTIADKFIKEMLDLAKKYK